jgi:hypothetical protein
VCASGRLTGPVCDSWCGSGVGGGPAVCRDCVSVRPPVVAAWWAPAVAPSRVWVKVFCCSPK